MANKNIGMDTVEQFEKEIANFYDAPYAVATDSCTHAIELCLRHRPPAPGIELSVPARTYISIPFTLIKLDLQWKFVDQVWQDYYHIGGTNIIDAAVFFQRGGYIRGNFMCLSFQFKKALSLGRGGAVLCDNLADYEQLKRMSHDGRNIDAPWRDQNIAEIGYHYYMTPETADLGIQKLQYAVPKPTQGSDDYPYLPNMDVFKYNNKN